METSVRHITETVMGNGLRVGGYFLKEGKPVYITNGSFWGEYGLSNFWYWKKVKPNGSLGREQHGYGGSWTEISRDEALRLAAEG